MTRTLTRLAALAFGTLGCATVAAGGGMPTGRPLASVDLTTSEGASSMGAVWRYSDTRVVETAFRAADSEGQPTGAPVQTYDILPRAGAADYDDSDWQVLAPESLSTRRAAGKVCFNWYRVRVHIPERLGKFDPAGSTVVFQTSLDDYAEVWVDGELPRAFAQSGGSVVKGWNAPNRLVVGRNVRPGQEIQLAVFGINGPISAAPTNFIWLREARLEFHRGPRVPLALTPQEVNVDVARLDPAIDLVVPPNAKVFKLAEGFTFAEGPVWAPDGALLFSDPNENRIYRYAENGLRPGTLSVFRRNSGYEGADIAEYGQPGSNGLAFDAQGRLVIDEHGNRRVTRLDRSGRLTVLVDNFEGRRLNSPNDVVLKRDGTVYFTDPPFGLPRFFDDPRKELAHSGVYRVTDRGAELLARDLTGPNGLAFSPDESYLYVSNWDPERKVVMRYPVTDDGRLQPGSVFFDMTDAPGAEALDGLKVDTQGNLFVAGPGGIWVLSPAGKHLGTIRLPKLAANFAWGGSDGRTLYITARGTLYRMALLTGGAPPESGRSREHVGSQA